MTEIHQLHQDPDAQHMRVAFDKGINYLNSFFALFDNKRKEIGDAKMPDWCFYQLRVSLSIVKKISEVLDDVDKARVQESIKLAREIEKQQKIDEKKELEDKKKAEKRAEDLRKHEEFLDEQRERQERAIKEAEERAKTQKLEAKVSGSKPKAPRKPRAVGKKTTNINIQNLDTSGMSTTLVTLLTELNQKTESFRVDLGRIYAGMRTEVDGHRAGKDPDGKWWSWTKWQQTFIPRSIQDVHKCIQEYKNTMPVYNTDRDDIETATAS